MPSTALFIGAHPDDLEIAAGGTIAKLVDQGWNVWLMIMTRERDEATAALREQEARLAAEALGVPENRILFLGAPDGLLGTVPTPEIVHRMRDATKLINADLIFTHSSADDHQDHRATHEITCAAMRERPRLYFPVINHLRVSAFTPQIFVDVSKHWDRKLSSLRFHKSQAERINEENITTFCRSFVDSAGLSLAESYELEIPAGSESRLAQVAAINESSFHRFWSTLIDDRPLNMITSVPISRSVKEFNWPSHHDVTGIVLFRRSMDLRRRLPGGVPAIEEFRCDQRQAEETLKAGADVLLSGGAVSNAITRHYFNHFDGIRYVIDYSMPDYRNVRILDRTTGVSLKASYETDVEGNTIPSADIGILTIMRNPYDSSRMLIAMMGIHGFGTIGCFKMVSEPPLISALLSKIEIPITGRGYQMLIKYEVRTGKSAIVDESVHMIK
jgi:LmbE family N-acetylglucosaminyl deacetylase